MLDQLKPVSNWEYTFLFLLCLLCFLIGYLFARWYYKQKMNAAIDDCNAEKKALKNELSSKKVEAPVPSVAKPVESVAAAVADVPKPKVSLDFSSFGKADASQKDDLKLISGVGPFIEKKLNGIGIYTFDQISKFTSKDINDVTDLIEFFPGRIERDDWAGQAESLKK